ncbi:MAG TPA: PQQ-binding-like beta-propeller repeat protein [Pirellulales bacterium]|nr:PQQ-binding-like beta-propeller repeat protein [Pirellulales bacterium]
MNERLETASNSVLRLRASAMALAVGCLLSCASQARAQIVLAAPVVASEENPNEPKRPFTLPAQKNEVAESLADFRRYAEKTTWERAFKALEKVQEADPNALTPSSSDGLYMPTRQVLRLALAELPPAGKQAYRLFHDADAKTLFSQAEGKDETEKLRKVFNDFFITSVGDAAADRLGDIYFEQGEMDKAAECWQAVVKWCPESSLPRVRLLVKSAIAEARGGHWDAFDDLNREVRQRHAEEKVVLGGKSLAASEHLDAFEKKNRPETRAAESRQPDLHLPVADAPSWQFRIIPQRDASAIAQVGMNWGWGMRFPVAEMVPAAAVDDQRAYLNFLGYLLAVDVKTGKLLWRSARFSDLAQKVQQNQYHYPEQYAIVVSGDTLWCVTRDVGQIGQHGQPFRIGRWEAATGKAGWNSQNINDLQQWNIMGVPLPAGDRVYVAAAKNGQGAEQYVLALQASDGKLLWSTHLGTHQADQTQMWHRRTAQPSLILAGGRLFVESHAGGLVALDAASGAIEWAFAYDSSMPDTNNWYNQPSSFTTLAPPILVGKTLYIKGMRSDRIYAIDVSTPKLLWKRPVGESSMLVGVDDENLYLSGEEVLAIDLATQKLKWASRLPNGTGWLKPLVTHDRVYQFTSRGIFELDKRNGDTVRLFRGSDLDSLGGVMLATSTRVLTVSNLAVTAYALSEGAGRDDATKSAQATAAIGAGRN